MMVSAPQDAIRSAVGRGTTDDKGDSGQALSPKFLLTRKIVDVAAIKEQVAIHGVTERGKVARERHACSYVAPQAAGGVHLHLGLGDVSCHTEVGQPQILQCS